MIRIWKLGRISRICKVKPKIIYRTLKRSIIFKPCQYPVYPLISRQNNATYIRLSDAAFFFFLAQFLRSLTSLGNARHVLELGLFTGCTALAFAESIPEDGKVVSCELDPYIADLARSHLDKSECGKKVDIMLGTKLLFFLI